MALLMKVQKLVWSLGADLSNVSLFGLKGWGKLESWFKTLSRAVVVGDSCNGCRCPLGQWRSLCRCSLAHWSQGKNTRMIRQGPECWQMAQISGRLWQAGFSMQLEIKKEQRDQFRKYILLYSDKIHFTCFMRLMSPAPDYKNLIGILIGL